MKSELFKRIVSSVILIPLALYFIIKGSFLLIFFLSVLFLASTYEWHQMSKKNFYLIPGFIFLLLSFVSAYLVINIYGASLFLMVIIICVFTDLGGYIFGKLIKGPKLTKLSPNKTYAGMIGGYFLSLVVLIITTSFVDYPEISMQLFLISILISTISQIGDIIVSYFKRLSKIKDTGKILPGHGGLLDRIDGMIFAFPIYYLFSLTNYLNT